MGGIGPSSLICIDVRPFCLPLSFIGRLDGDVTAPIYKTQLAESVKSFARQSS